MRISPGFIGRTKQPEPPPKLADCFVTDVATVIAYTPWLHCRSLKLSKTLHLAFSAKAFKPARLKALALCSMLHIKLSSYRCIDRIEKLRNCIDFVKDTSPVLCIQPRTELGNKFVRMPPHEFPARPFSLLLRGDSTI